MTETGSRLGVASRSRRILPWVLGVSLLLHVAAVGLLVPWTARRRVPPPAPSLATVAMIIQKSTNVSEGTPGAQAVPPQPQPAPTPPQPPKPAQPPQQASAKPPPPPPRKPPPDPAPLDPAAVPMPPPPAPHAAPDEDSTAEVNLGTGSEFSAGRVSGSAIVAAKLDAGFRNFPPHYPPAAAARNEEGTVDLLIHVAPSGDASSVDIVESSGYTVLDEAARDAVLRWHFNPEQKDGLPVASELPFRMIFGLDHR